MPMPRCSIPVCGAVLNSDLSCPNENREGSPHANYIKDNVDRAIDASDRDNNGDSDRS